MARAPAVSLTHPLQIDTQVFGRQVVAVILEKMLDAIGDGVGQILVPLREHLVPRRNIEKRPKIESAAWTPEAPCRDLSMHTVSSQLM